MASEPHPDAQALLDNREDPRPDGSLDASELREQTRPNQLPTGDPEPVEDVETRVIRGTGHGLPVRIYTPRVEKALDRVSLPVLVWAHGGGFVLGDIETEDALGRALANACGCLVASVDYRLAPEHPFPAALQDVYAVVNWMSEHASEVGGDPARILVGGASAGGNLAAATALLARDRGGPELVHQVLAYPAVSFEGDFETRRRYDGYFVTEEFSDWVNEQYLSDSLYGRNCYAYPLEACDFTELPPATVVTAGFDPMLGESRAYAKALEGANVSATTHHYDDMIHSFLGRLQNPEWERAREAVNAIGQDIRDVV